MIAQLDREYFRTRPIKSLQRIVSYALFEGRPVTTRGRWINRLVFAHFSLAKRLPALRNARSPIFIVGTGRSGTTVLGKILSLHPDVAFLNEPKALWNAVHPGEDLIGSYSSDSARYRLDEFDATPERIQCAHRLFGSYLFWATGRRVLDKYPELIFRVPFVRMVFPGARFLFVMRNGWDTCASIREWSARHGSRDAAGVQDWWGVDGRKWNLLVDQLVLEDEDLASNQNAIRRLNRDVDRAAVEWILTMREGLRLTREMPGNVLPVRYECLAEQPSRVLKQIELFCCLECDVKMRKYADKVLVRRPPRPHFRLDPTIAPTFEKTLIETGYA